jgi:hypothetical protein
MKPSPQMPVIERRIRWYQQPFHSALVNAKHDRLIEIAHRRWGKDEMILMGMCEIANNPACPKFRVGNYWHCFPEYNQARKALWEGINANTGKRLRTWIPHPCSSSSSLDRHGKSSDRIVMTPPLVLALSA